MLISLKVGTDYHSNHTLMLYSKKLLCKSIWKLQRLKRINPELKKKISVFQTLKRKRKKVVVAKSINLIHNFVSNEKC
jgi:hypothetical protein